jgi:hypothetical protein
MAEVQFLLTFLGMVGTIEIVKKPELCRILAILWTSRIAADPMFGIILTGKEAISK